MNKSKVEATPLGVKNHPEGQRRALNQDPRLLLVDGARRRMEAQRSFYEEGLASRFTGFSMRCPRLKDAEVLAAATQDERVAAVEAYLNRVKEVEKRERSELDLRRGTTADVEEATFCREKAEMELRQVQKHSRPLDLESLDRRLSAVERKLDLILRALPPASQPPRR